MITVPAIVPDPERTAVKGLGHRVPTFPNSLPASATINAEACSGSDLLEKPA
jgi:hypothetical protein